ncbi:unnamed protein product, partial [Tetraodon nigroviridis]
VKCRNNKENLNFVKSYSPKHPEVQHLKILLNGPVGAGKSSFISSVDSVLHGDIMCRALTNVKLVDGSFTKTYKTYRFLRQSDPNNPFGFSINDIVGLEESKGVHINDISLALKGHVKDGYKFNPSCPLTEGDEGYNPSPTLQDRVHVLVSVFAADNETILTKEMQKKMREIRNIASELGELKGPAQTDGKLIEGSFTKTYKNYRFPRVSDPNSPYCFSINDIAGLEDRQGVHVDDVILALKGHVKDGYKFKPSSPLTESDEGYNPSPTLQDRVHVLVSVIAADNETILTEEMQKKMREIRNIASELGISQLAILTRCDKACPAVADGMANLYKSKYLKGMADELGDKLGIPPNCIFLVKNYEEETRIRDDVDAPILCALRQIISSGDDFLTD